MITNEQLNNQKVEMGYLVDFEKAIENNDAASILRLWEEYTSTDEVDGEDYRAILEAVKISDLKDYIGRHIERGLHLWNLMKPGPLKNEVLRLIVDLEITENPDLRVITLNFLKEKFKEDPAFGQKMRLIGLRGNESSFKGAISHYLLLNHMKKGNFVFHTAGWGVGEIMDVSMLREQINCEFDYVPGRKDLPFRIAFQTLIRIPKTHFLARRFGHPEELEAQAKKDPVEVVRLLLKDLGPKTAAEIKDEICELVIPVEKWNKWWQTTRAKIKRDTQIETPKDAKSPFRLLKQEISHEERLKKAIEEKPDANTLINMMHTFVKDFPQTLKNRQFKASVLEKLKELIALKEITPAQELQLHFLFKDLSDAKDYPPIDALLKRSESIENLIQGIPIQVFKKRALIQVRRVRTDWESIFLSLLFTLEHNPLRDFTFNQLLSSPSAAALEKQLKALAVTPEQHPELVIWYFHKILANQDLPMADFDGQSRFFEALLILLSYLEQQADKRDLIKKIHHMLSAGRFALVRQIMKNASIEDVREFLLLVTKCHSLADHDIQIFHSLAEVAHPKLKEGQKKTINQDEETIWTTKEGYTILQKRIEHIGTVETVKNAKEIELARSYRDLRENAEFKAALERRDRLQAELKSLSDQLNQCRILTHQDIDTSQVSVGTRVDLRCDDGTQTSYTFLGPWDADPDQQILSFQSKLAQSVFGKKKGDTLQLQGKHYTIENISSAI